MVVATVHATAVTESHEDGKAEYQQQKLMSHARDALDIHQRLQEFHSKFKSEAIAAGASSEI